MEEGGKLEAEKGGQVEQLLWYCVITRGLNTPYVGIWDRAWQVRAELEAIEHHAKTTACVCLRAKSPTDTSSYSLSLIRTGERVFIEEETPFHWKINRFTVHHWGNNIKKAFRFNGFTDAALSVLFLTTCFCFAFLRCREVKPSGVDTCGRKTFWETARET